MATPSHFLWPRSRKPSFSHYRRSQYTHAAIEHAVQKLFPSSFPVLFSSGRAAINAILAHENVSRPDLVYCPPYSSHCVFDAISRLGTPTTKVDANASVKAALIYHQWGYLHQNHFNNAGFLIEDAADTLFIPDAELFAAGGRYTVCSLPKTFGTSFGGLAFCKSEKDAEALDAIRHNRGRFFLQPFMRLFSERSETASIYWLGGEAVQGTVPYFARQQIMEMLGGWETLVQDRLALLKRLSPAMADYAEASKRIPCTLPLIQDKAVGSRLWDGDDAKINTGFRNFNCALSAPDDDWKPVAPLPVHRDIDSATLDSFIGKIGQDNLKDEPGIL